MRFSVILLFLLPSGVSDRSIASEADRVLRELEGRLRDLRVRVLVTVGEPRQAAHAHHDYGVAGSDQHPGRRRRNGDVDAETRAHRLDRRFVRRVQACLDNAEFDIPLNLLSRQHAPTDVAVAREHRVGEREAEVDFARHDNLRIQSTHDHSRTE